MNKPIPIKPFKTIEEAKFWDSHDTSPLLEGEDISITNLPLLEKEKDTSITVRIQISLKTRLEQEARKKGVNPSTLARMWLIERLQSV